MATVEMPSGMKAASRIGAQMMPSERVMLYALVYGLRPERSLEIGTCEGGSARIIVDALDEIGSGMLACIDPNFDLAPSDFAAIKHRTNLVSGKSPNKTAHASALLSGPFDFALIDGDHSPMGVKVDVDGLIPYLNNNAVVLFHDAWNLNVAYGIKMSFSDHSNLEDCGIVTIEDTYVNGVRWGGMRMARFHKVN